MPESTPQRTLLDSFLPQFAPSTDAANPGLSARNGQAQADEHALSSVVPAINGSPAPNGHGPLNGSTVDAVPVNGMAVNGTPINGTAVNGADMHAIAGNGATGFNDHASDGSDEGQLFLDDELALGFEEFEAGAVDNLHGASDLAEVLLPAADRVVGLFDGAPSIDSSPASAIHVLESHALTPTAASLDPVSVEAPLAEPEIVAGQGFDSPATAAALPPSANGAASSNGVATSHKAASLGAAEQTSAAPAASRPPEPQSHPAAGSLFVPYLVTEVPGLRNRRARRRSWWRRLFS